MIQTVKTLNASQVAYLRAAIHCLLAVQGEAGGNQEPGAFDAGRRYVCKDLRNDALDLATDHGTVSPLDHQDGAELADLLAGATLELRTPAGITPYFSDAPGSYTDQVGADEEAFKVPCMLTVAGAATEDEAAVMADSFLGRAMADATVNADEVVLAFEVGYEAAFVPVAALSAGEAVRQG